MKHRGREKCGRGLISAALVAIVSALSVAGSTDLASPPRFDGAGYAVLGEALATGRGYREIDLLDAPRHGHFPPGYPAVLSVLWRLTGRSADATHIFSAVCAVAAMMAALCWFRAIYPPGVALALGLALAVNWTWARTGGAIQSEPLFLLLGQTSILAACWIAPRGGARRGVLLGLLLAACLLTRHVGACLALAIVLDLWIRGRRLAAAAAGMAVFLLALPWAAWLISIGRGTQPGLLAQGGLGERVVRQSLFYIQRLPDQLTGPVVEIGTVFRSSASLSAAVNAWALAATAILIFGWMRTFRSQRRRLAGLIAMITLGLLLVWPFTEAGRFLIPLVPVILVGGVEGLGRLAALVGLRHPRAWAACALLAISVPYAGYALASGRAGAQQRTHRDFDLACAWIAHHPESAGLVLSRHPGEVYWQTGRRALTLTSDDPAAIADAVDRFGVAYLLVDTERYVGAPTNPLARFADRYPARVEKVWSQDSGLGSVTVYLLVPPATGPSK